MGSGLLAVRQIDRFADGVEDGRSARHEAIEVIALFRCQRGDQGIAHALGCGGELIANALHVCREFWRMKFGHAESLAR